MTASDDGDARAGQSAGRIGYEETDHIGREDGVRVGGVPHLTEAPSPFGGERDPDPCSLVIFGVTGDLTHRKLIPALYDLGCHGVLPFGTTLVGYGRQAMSDDDFRALMQEAIDDHYGAEVVDGSLCERILQAPRYVQGQFDDPDGYRRLGAVLDELDTKGARGNRMFYLATPPSQFDVIVRQLGGSGLARSGACDAGHAQGDPAGWTRVVIEKPFGRDLGTAEALDRVIAEVFDERQVYRIDHYLAKETVQNLLVLRFANGIFEPVWNRRYVDFVEITAAETLGVEHRGPYYEEAGALRDMITPHLIQLFSLVAMEPPVAFGADAVRDEKLKVLRAVRPIPVDEVSGWAVRAQYVQGVLDGESVPAYRSEDRVAPDSHTETYAALKLLVDNWRWQGVPFYLRTGKRLPRRVTEIAIHFKRPPVLLFRDAAAGGGGVQPNVLVLRVQPDEGFSLSIESKKPGHAVALQPVSMDYSYGTTLHELPFSAYETVLVDAMEGDMTLFTRGDQAEEAWRIVGPVLEAWAAKPERDIPIYEAGSWGPEAADALIARDGHYWRRPWKEDAT